MFVRTPLRAPEGAEGGSAAAAAGSTVASETTTAPATTQPGSTTTAPQDIAKLVADAVGAALAPLRTEFVDFRREARNKFAVGTTAPGATANPPATAAAATPAAGDVGLNERIAGLERTAALNGVYADLGIKPGAQRDFIETATKGLPAESVRAFVESYLKTLPTAPTTTTTVTPAAVTTNPVTPPVATGAASTAVKPNTGDLESIDPEVLKSLPYEERMKLYDEHRSRGPNHSPYAGAKTRQLAKLGRK